MKTGPHGSQTDLRSFLLRLLVAGKKVFHAVAGHGKHGCVGQVDDAEMVRMDPVEARSMCNEDFFLFQQVKSELFVVTNMEALDVHFWENVKGCLRFDATDPGNVGQATVDKLTLFIDPAAWLQHLFCFRSGLEGRSNDGLCRYVRAQAHG